MRLITTSLFVLFVTLIFAQKPNVVIIYADDMGYSDVSVYGQLHNTPSPASTPHMDALATEGMMFTQAHSGSAVCTPSRYALLTGKYNWRTLNDGVSGSYGQPEIPSSDITIAEYLKTQGYETAAFGKWHLGGTFYNRQGQAFSGRNTTVTDPADVDWERPLDGHALDNGFDVFKGLPCAIGRPPYVYMDGNRLQYFDTITNEYRNALNTDSFHFFIKDELNAGLTTGTTSREGLGDPSYTQLQCEPQMIQQAEDYIADRVGDSDPFFMYVALYSPHKPWQVTPAFQGSEGFQYGDFMHEVDDRVGRIIDAIDNNGFTNNTIVIVTSDNGPENTAFNNSMDNGRDPNGPFRGIKRDSWEGGTRVPFIVRWPGVVQAGSTSDVLTWHGDIFRTLGELFGDCLPQTVAPDAVSILSVLNGSSTTVVRNAIVTASNKDQLSVKTTDGWKLIDGTGGGGNNTSYDADNNAIIDARGTIGGSPKQLFYLPNDMPEINNLESLMPEKATEMLALLNEIRQGSPGNPVNNSDTIAPTEAITIAAATPSDDGGLSGNFVLRERTTADHDPNKHISGFVKFDLSNINTFSSANGDVAFIEVKLTDRLNANNASELKVARITGGDWDAANLPQYTWATASLSPIGPGSQTDESVIIGNVATAALNSTYLADVTSIVEDWVSGNAPNYGLGLYLTEAYQGVSLENITLSFQTACNTPCVGADCNDEQSTALVTLNRDGTLTYTADNLGNTLIDYGMVGYRQSVCPIPDVPVVMTLNPSAGDRTADIQAAIDAIEAMPQNQYGHRGALLLTAGDYELQGELTIDASGVVIRGEGSETDGTILRHFGTTSVNVLTISASASIQKSSATLKNVIDTYVPIGAKKVTVASGHTFEKGDAVVFTREPYQAWIEAIGMDTLLQFCGAGHGDWTPSSYTIDSKHNIVDVIGDTLFFDTPVADPIEVGYATAYVQKYDWVGIEECGVENIRFESNTNGDPEDENHANHAISMNHLRNGWFRNIKSKDFINNCTNIINSYQITVDSCEVENYVSLVTGGRRYGFTIEGQSQLILVKNCTSNQGRHCFASGSRVRGPNVFYNCTSTNASTDSGPHHRWATGFLYENIVTNMHLWVQNRLCSGSGHGWTGGQHLFWNCDIGGSIILQDPPTEQTNWAIGCRGTITNQGAFDNFVAPLGYVESHDNPIDFSLYENQARNYKLDNIINNDCLICPDHSINDADLDGVCDDEDACPTLNDNLIGTVCDDGDPCTELSIYQSDCNCVPIFNFALPGEASMSSGIEYRAAYLNDEIIDNSLLSHTDDNSPNEWMQIDLGANRNIDEVLIWNRTNCCSERLSNVYVLVADTPFPSDTDLNTALANADFTYQLGNTSQEALLTISVQQPGRYVRLQKSGNNNGDNYLNILELQVMGDTTQIDANNDGFCDNTCIDIQLQAWLEGAYYPTLGEMTTTLSSNRKLLPGQTPNSPLAVPTLAGQPYHIAPWNYAGTEGAGWTDADYNGSEVDWILISFRTGTAKNTEVAMTSGILMKDGVIELPDRCALPAAVTGPLYIVLEHRNHIGIMTPQPVDIIGGILSYDFRATDSYRDATSFGQKQLSNGEWAMFAGDADQMDFPSFDVNGTDKTEWFENNGVFDYYLSPDFNLDGDVNGQDKSLWFENNGISSRVPK